MESQNQFYYNRNQGPPGCMPPPPPQQQQPQPDPSFPVTNMDSSKMGPMMRALTEDFDVMSQNSSGSYPQQGMPSMPGAGEQQRIPSNNFGPASQTLSGYASQYSTGPGSHNYFGHGHSPSPLNSGFSSPGSNYPPGGMTSPYQRQIPGSSPLGSPNGHGHPYPRSASAGPTIPSPIMMHGSGMYPHNQTSPGNRSTPFGFPTSPTSPHNHLNHASPPLASPSSMRPGGNLHSPKSLPASSPVPFVSQMSPTASRAQSVPTLPGNSLDHLPTMAHQRSKSPGSAGIHRPYPQPPSQQQQLYPLPSPKVRPVDQTDSRGQYVELVHTKPSGEQWNPVERPKNDISRSSSEHQKISDPGHLPRLEEMVAVLSDTKVKESLDEIVSDKNLPVIENGSPGELRAKDNVNHNAQNNNGNARVSNGTNESSPDQGDRELPNGLSGSEDMKSNSDNGPSGEHHLDSICPVKKVTKTYSGKVSDKSNGRTGVSTKQGNVDLNNSTNNVNNSPFKPPPSKQSRPQNCDQTKESKSCNPQDTPFRTEETGKVTCKTEDNTSDREEKTCKTEEPEDTKQSVSDSMSPCENIILKHSPETEPGKSVPSTSSQNDTNNELVSKTPPPNNPMTTPTMKRKSPVDSGSSTGNESLPLKKRRGRPPGSKNRKEGEEGKPKKKYTKKKKLDLEGEKGEDQVKQKPGKLATKAKVDSGVPTIRGPLLRVQGSSIESVVSSKVVNTPDAEEDNVKSGKKKQQKAVKHNRRQMVVPPGHAGQAAILASECHSPTGLWVCRLCGNPPNFGVLGDLYGPYYPPGCDVSSSDRDIAPRSERHCGSDSRDNHHGYRGSRQKGAGTSRMGRVQESRSQKGKSLMAKQADLSKTRKWRQIKTYMEEMSLSSGRKSAKRRKSEGDEEVLELWVHEECAVWSQGVIFLQGILYGIHETAKEADTKKCSLCRDTGASIGCLSKGCKQTYHYLCAVESECLLNPENYSMSCPKHKDKKVKMRGET